MLKKKWSIVLRKGFIISLGVLLTLSFALFFGGNKVFADSSNPVLGINVNVYDIDAEVRIRSFSLTGNQILPGLQCHTAQSSSCIYYYWGNSNGTSAAYSSGITLSSGSAPTYSVTYYWTYEIEVVFDNKYIGSFTYHTDTDSTVKTHYVNGDRSTFIIQDYTDQLYFDSFSLIPNSQYLYDIDFASFGAISYFAANGGNLQNNNAFTGVGTLRYPTYKGFSLDTSSYLLTDGTTDDYILILAIGNTYQVFTNITTSSISSAYANVNIGINGYKRYSNGLQVNYQIFNNANNGDTYGHARYYINYSTAAINRFNNYQYIPLYYGKLSECPDEILHYAGLFTPEEQAGNETSSDLDAINTDLNNEISAVDNIQNQLQDDFQDNIQAIDTDIDFVTSFGQKFVTSAQWVRTQFETLTTQTPYGSILFFALTLGLALMIIGRVI